MKHATFLRVVEERFAVTRGKGFDADPATWRGAEVVPSTSPGATR